MKLRTLLLGITLILIPVLAFAQVSKIDVDTDNDGWPDGKDVTFGALWNNNVNAAQMQKIYSYLVQLDTDLDGDLTDETWWVGVPMPTGTNPQVNAVGEIAQDTDGANVANDTTVKIRDTAGNQIKLGGKLKFPLISIQYPHDFAPWTGRAKAGAVIDASTGGMDMVIQTICVLSDAEIWFDLFETNVWNGMDDDVDTQIGTTIQVNSVGDAAYYKCVNYDPDITIESGHKVIIEIADSSPTSSNQAVIWIEKFYLANVD